MAFPAVPRNAKGYDIENAINRILRWLNPGFGSDNAGKVLTSNSDGTDLEWADIPHPTLTYLTAALTADVDMSVQSQWYDGPSVSQGTSGTFLAGGHLTLLDTSTDNPAFGVRLWDGTNTYAETALILPTQNNNATVAFANVVIESPAGDLRLAAKNFSGTGGVMRWSPLSFDKGSLISAVRIA